MHIHKQLILYEFSLMCARVSNERYWYKQGAGLEWNVLCNQGPITHRRWSISLSYPFTNIYSLRSSVSGSRYIRLFTRFYPFPSFFFFYFFFIILRWCEHLPCELRLIIIANICFRCNLVYTRAKTLNFLVKCRNESRQFSIGLSKIISPMG